MQSNALTKFAALVGSYVDLSWQHQATRLLDASREFADNLESERLHRCRVLLQSSQDVSFAMPAWVVPGTPCRAWFYGEAHPAVVRSIRNRCGIPMVVVHWETNEISELPHGALEPIELHDTSGECTKVFQMWSSALILVVALRAGGRDNCGLLVCLWVP